MMVNGKIRSCTAIFIPWNTDKLARSL